MNSIIEDGVFNDDPQLLALMPYAAKMVLDGVEAHYPVQDSLKPTFIQNREDAAARAADFEDAEEGSEEISEAQRRPETDSKTGSTTAPESAPAIDPEIAPAASPVTAPQGQSVKSLIKPPKP